MVHERSDLCWSVMVKVVHGHHYWQAIILTDVVNVPIQVHQTLLHGFDVLHLVAICVAATMVLQCFDGSNDDSCRRSQSRQPAFDVDEFLSTEIRSKASLRDAVVTKLHTCKGGHVRVAAVRDVGKGAAMDHGDVVLKSLDNVGFQGVFHERSHGTMRLQIGSCDALALREWSLCLANYDLTKPFSHVGKARGHAQDGHHL
mmetsp:Transcript_101124/g.179497  ORF Transcript_101124/g.179497 Transcript_101124/m.179497 type:complete len:201 (+) Transcript_101124:581-1183(+)